MKEWIGPSDLSDWSLSDCKEELEDHIDKWDPFMIYLIWKRKEYLENKMKNVFNDPEREKYQFGGKLSDKRI